MCAAGLLDMKKASYEPGLVVGPDLISCGVRASIQQFSKDVPLVSRCHPSGLALDVDKSLLLPWVKRRMISSGFREEDLYCGCPSEDASGLSKFSQCGSKWQYAQ